MQSMTIEQHDAPAPEPIGVAGPIEIVDRNFAVAAERLKLSQEQRLPCSVGPCQLPRGRRGRNQYFTTTSSSATSGTVANGDPERLRRVGQPIAKHRHAFYHCSVEQSAARPAGEARYQGHARLFSCVHEIEGGDGQLNR